MLNKKYILNKLLIATHNPAKLNYYKMLLSGFDLELKSLDALGVIDDIEENGKSEEENALLKARFFVRKSGLVCLSDDAGLYIDALNGEPGVMTRRWMGKFHDDVDDKEWLDYLLERMKDVPKVKRTGYFKIVRVVVKPDNNEYIINSKREFTILEKPNWKYYKKGWPTGMMAMIKGYDRPWIALTDKEKLEIDKDDILQFKDIFDSIRKAGSR